MDDFPNSAGQGNLPSHRRNQGRLNSEGSRPVKEAFDQRELPRGGLLLVWGDFVAQIGVYPETIKDTMGLPCGVPRLYVVPERLFDVAQGISMAELEFPIYYNFFLKGQKTVVVCQRNRFRAIVAVLQESIFGPRSLNLERDYPSGHRLPEMKAEMAYFKDGPLTLRDLVDFRLFDEQGQVDLGEVRIRLAGADRYRFERLGQLREATFRTPPRPSPAGESAQRFRPPFFGLTIIGSGHGFDPKQDTTGFVIWLNGRGVLVDPPVNTTRWLRKHGIDTRMISDLVLTHCHADHDSGTLQKILEEGRINLHTTRTVLESFLRKYKGLLGLTGQQMRLLFNFHPFRVAESVNIAGGSFFFRYNFHSIPTLGLEVSFQGKKLAYSGDTLYDAETLQRLHREDLFSETRLHELLGFSWDADLIIHEAGIPPVHTPLSVLNALSDSIKERLYLNHLNASSIPEGSGLRMAPTGVDKTFVLEVPPPDLWLAQRMLDVLSGVELFQQMGIEKAAVFLRIARLQQFQAGQMILHRGDPGDRFYLILSGEADVARDGKVLSTLGRFDYFGEVALMLSQSRTADIVACSDLEVLAVERADFFRFIRGTVAESALLAVAESRLHDAWPLMNDNPFLEKLSVMQKTSLIPLMKLRQIPPERPLFRQGDRVRCLYLLRDGRVRLEAEGSDPVTAGHGALVGRLRAHGERHAVSVVTETTTSAYVIAIADMEEFFLANPGTYVRFLAVVRSRPSEVT